MGSGVSVLPGDLDKGQERRGLERRWEVFGRSVGIKLVGVFKWHDDARAGQNPRFACHLV